jgi:hypothetical protein
MDAVHPVSLNHPNAALLPYPKGHTAVGASERDIMPELLRKIDRQSGRFFSAHPASRS